MAHLTIDERFKIYEMQKAGYSSRYIGSKIGRNKSTVNYELQRIKEEYRPDKAQELATSLRKNKQKRKLDLNESLRKQIVDQLKQGIAPDVISGRQKLQMKERVSTEAIYQFIYNSDFAKGEKLHLYLASKRKARLRHGSRPKRKMISIPNRVSIADRAKIDRHEADIGNLEGDLTFNKGNQSRNIGGLVDMRSQKLFLTLNRSKKTSEVIGNMNKKLSKVKHLIKTVTFDNGKEFTNHGDLIPKSSRKVYFCNAYSPWQKPLIEKINSMIHRVYSKSADITKLTKKKLQKIEDFLNNLPRKILGYKTPNEVWEENVKLA